MKRFEWAEPQLENFALGLKIYVYVGASEISKKSSDLKEIEDF